MSGQDLELRAMQGKKNTYKNGTVYNDCGGQA